MSSRGGWYYLALISLTYSISANQFASAETESWSNVFDTSARYYAWTNSTGGSGSQIYVPFAVQTTGRPNDDWKLEFLVRSGYIWSRQSLNGVSATGSSVTDTTLGTTVTYYGWQGVQPFVSLNVNAPTAGASNGSTSTSRPDSDLVATPIFGQGWNIGPSGGASFAINQSLVATVSFGYTYRGPFDEGPSLSPLPPGQAPAAGRLKPGDVSTVNTGLGYKGDRLAAQISVSYSTETTTYHGALPLFQAGDRVIVSAKAGYAWTDNWSSRIATSYSHFNRNKVAQVGLPDLVRETLNSNSDVYSVSFDTSYARANYSIGPVVSYLYRNHNGYDPTNLAFTPAKTSWSAGVSGQIAPTNTTSISASVAHVWVNEGDSPDKIIPVNFLLVGSGIPASSTNAWVVSIGSNIRF
ncbi:MAG TPA: hypothetical protein VLX09_12875 [Stellaceae bacterium]|nr:hypothetical protein [Stellaceae bacterium]